MILSTATRALSSVAAAGVMALAGCGTLGGEGGGAENLPNRGIVPYVKLGTAEAPFLVPSAPGTEHIEPATVFGDGRLELYFEVRTGTSSSRIARTTLDPATIANGAIELVLEAVSGPSWVGDRVGAPSVLLREGVLHLVFAASRRAIGRARSAGGARFAIDPEPLLVAAEPYEQGGIGAPSLVATDRGLELYYEAVGADGRGRIARARASGAEGPFAREGIVLEPGIDCKSASGDVEPCWDADGVESPEVRVAKTSAGRTLLRMLYVGVGSKGRRGIGFASAWPDGRFERYRYNPILDEPDVNETGPTNVRLDDRYLLLFSEARMDGQGVRAAVNDAGLPSESF